MNTARRTIIAVVAHLALAAQVTAVEVRLKSEAHCGGTLVRLSDVAEVEPAAGEDAVALGDLILFPVPAVGKMRVLKQQQLRELLLLCGVEPRELVLTGADSAVIHAGQGETTAVIRPPLYLIPPRASVKMFMLRRS